MGLVHTLREKRNARTRESKALRDKLLSLTIENEELKKSITEAQGDAEELERTKASLKNIQDLYESQKVSYGNLLKKTEEVCKENKELKERLFSLQLQIPEQFPVETIMDNCAARAWSGAKAERVFMASDEKTKIIFCGTVYEPGYEFFTAGCNVYVEQDGIRQPLRTISSKNVAAYKNVEVETGSISDVYNWIATTNLAFAEI